MTIWTLRLLVETAVMVRNGCPRLRVGDVEDNMICEGGKIVESSEAPAPASAVLPCEGSKFGCGRHPGGSCVIRYGMH